MGFCGKVLFWGMFCGKIEVVCFDMFGRLFIVIFCLGMFDLNCCLGDCRIFCLNCELLIVGIKVWFFEGIICYLSF